MANTVPNVDPDRGFRLWARSQIFTGPSGAGQYVPNVDDLVHDFATGWWRVTAVNVNTNISTLQKWISPDEEIGIISEDILLGSGPGSQSESYRAYLNTTVVPHTLALDSRLRVYGSSNAYCKVFRGTDTSVNGVVISAMVNQSGQVISENIPLETVQVPSSQQTVAIKTPVPAYSVETLTDGEVVTAVFYTAAGVVTSISKLLLKRTNVVRTLDASRKYITHVSLTTPFLSEEDNTLIEYPLNMLIQSGSIRGIVHYSDGSTSGALPIDGEKFQLHGLDSYVTSVVGQTFNLLLQYNLSANEYSYDVNGIGTERSIVANYRITSTEILGAYTVKLFAVPVWQSPTLGYKLEYWLYNLNRNEVYNVTQHVTLVSPYASYNPLPTGNAQTLMARIELSALGSSYAYYAHTQTFRLNLMTPGTSNTPNWWVEYTPGGAQYGGANSADITSTGTGIYTVDITNGKATQDEWLEALYYNAEPLIHPQAESIAPKPTHFRLKIGSTFEREVSIDSWNSAIENVNLTAPNPKQGEVVRLEWIRKQSLDVYELGLGYLPIHLV